MLLLYKNIIRNIVGEYVYKMNFALSISAPYISYLFLKIKIEVPVSHISYAFTYLLCNSLVYNKRYNVKISKLTQQISILIRPSTYAAIKT